MRGGHQVLPGARASMAIVMSIVLSACVSAPARQFRVIEGGLRSGPTPIPTQSTRPEPPIGVIMSGRVVLPCAWGPRCAYFARLVPLLEEPGGPGPEAAAAPSAPPDATPLPLERSEPALGRGPTARQGRVLDHEPAALATLTPGNWRVEVYSSLFEPARGRGLAEGAHALACALDFTVHAGDAFDVSVAFATPHDCRIALTSTFVTR